MSRFTSEMLYARRKNELRAALKQLSRLLERGIDCPHCKERFNFVELAATPEPPSNNTSISQWLEDTLIDEGGIMEASEITKKGVHAGFIKGSLRMARKRHGRIVSLEDGGKNYWCLLEEGEEKDDDQGVE